jgi:predicted TPR repeat methyltransferase
VSDLRLEEAAACYRSGRVEEAEQLAREAFSLDPRCEQAVLFYSGLLLQRQATADAERVLSGALSRGLDSPSAQANLAMCWSRQGRHEDAANLAQELTTTQPALLSAWNILGNALIELGQSGRAETVLLEGLRHHPDQPPLQLLLGRARAANGQPELARKDFEAFRRQTDRLVQEAEKMTLSGRLGEAEHAYQQLIRVQPDSASGYAGLGRLLLRMDRFEDARRALERALALDPGDDTSRHFLGAISGHPDPSAHPGYVQALFDGYADNFDDELTETLGYRIPEEVTKHLLDGRADLESVLDLGCGTGLVAEAMQGRYGTIDGVDLSSRMLELAGKRGGYDRLIERDVVDFLNQSNERWSTVVATDVLIYVGDFNRLIPALVERIEPGGWFAFSIELCEGEAFRLDPRTGRYQHDPDSVDRILLEHGLSAARWYPTTIRKELGSRIPGAIGLAQRPPL